MTSCAQCTYPLLREFVHALLGRGPACLKHVEQAALVLQEANYLPNHLAAGSELGRLRLATTRVINRCQVNYAACLHFSKDQRQQRLTATHPLGTALGPGLLRHGVPLSETDSDRHAGQTREGKRSRSRFADTYHVSGRGPTRPVFS